ncbi:putative cyclin-D7-1 [Bidens hawaiensis]|uniref:putative cyclin-D7-1 n=1 Tax=Bidens hawaiensis TaxID=980011 RepID=UPI004049A609
MTHHHNILDDFLLCDEEWDATSPVPSPHYHHAHQNHHNNIIIINNNNNNNNNLIQPITRQDFIHSFDTCVLKEVKFMTGSAYANFLQNNHFVAECRFKAIHWFIHRQRRFDFGVGTVFNAVNYVDRFIHMNKCHGWSYWMMELLSLASLSIAIKFGETFPPSMREIQEGLEYCFEAKLIQKMEMKILQSLGWEVNSVTPYSYVDLIEWELNQHFKPIVRSRFDEVLLASSLDLKLLGYRPCVIAVSGLRCILEDEVCLSHITSFIPTDQKKNVESCYNMMQEILVGYQKSELNRNPTSPDTVLTKEVLVPIQEENIDLSFIDGTATKDKLKRKRVHDHGAADDCVIMHKK